MSCLSLFSPSWLELPSSSMFSSSLSISGRSLGLIPLRTSLTSSAIELSLTEHTELICCRGSRRDQTLPALLMGALLDSSWLESRGFEAESELRMRSSVLRPPEPVGVTPAPDAEGPEEGEPAFPAAAAVAVAEDSCPGERSDVLEWWRGSRRRSSLWRVEPW